MIKFHVLYPGKPGARFDHTYYRDKHMPMVASRLGSACLYYSIDKGLAGGAPGAPSPYLAACSIACESLDALHRAMAPHAKEIMGDIRNYTDSEPIVWVSEAVVDRS